MPAPGDEHGQPQVNHHAAAGGPEEAATSPADGDTDQERENGLDWPADPDELADEDTLAVGGGLGGMQPGPTADYCDG